MKYVFLLLVSFVLVSCGNNDCPQGVNTTNPNCPNYTYNYSTPNQYTCQPGTPNCVNGYTQYPCQAGTPNCVNGYTQYPNGQYQYPNSQYPNGQYQYPNGQYPYQQQPYYYPTR